MPLNGKQKRRLRALGHHLAAVVQVGSSGVTPGVVAATVQALKDHELVKVKIADEREARQEAIAALLEATGAELAQALGRTALLFKKRSKKSQFEALFAGASTGKTSARPSEEAPPEPASEALPLPAPPPARKPARRPAPRPR